MPTLLDPPPGPAAPGAYDFARDAWFEGVGGVGLAHEARRSIIALADAALAPAARDGGQRLALVAGRAPAADIARGHGAQRPAAPRALPAAVTTSHQDWLDHDTRDDLRASGLAHMLAIAGLHTAAVTGFVFFALALG